MKISLSVFACPEAQLDAIPYIDGIQSLHFDFMDGSCVPLTGVSLQTFRNVASQTILPLDVHLMVNDQAWWLNGLTSIACVRRAILTIEHCSNPELKSLLGMAKENGCSPWVAIWPDTPVSQLESLSLLFDGILIMTSLAGTPGSVFLDSSYERVRLISKLFPDKRIMLDGGINASRLSRFSKYGIEESVIGRAFFDGHERTLLKKLCMEETNA